MSNALTEHGVVDVGMRVDMNDPDRAVTLHQRPKDRQHDGVVTAHRQGNELRCHQLVEVGFDAINRVEQVVRIGGHITGAGDAQMIVGSRPRCHVVRPQEHRLTTNATRTEPGTRTVRRADVERDPANGDVEL